MPFIKAKVSCPVSPEQESELKAGMGKAIGLVPGKSEDFLLLEFEDRCRLWLRGKNDEPIAYIEAAIFGNEMHCGYDAFTAEVTALFSKVLHIRPDHVYIKFLWMPEREKSSVRSSFILPVTHVLFPAKQQRREQHDRAETHIGRPDPVDQRRVAEPAHGVEHCLSYQ